MKKAILIMMFCLVCLGGIMAQQASYYPLIKEGDTLQKWNVINLPTMYYPNGYTTSIQSISGTVTLDGVEYKLVSNWSSWSQYVLGAVREENRQVFYRRNTGFNQVGYYDESYFQEEVLLYDFNLSVGDTVVVNWMQTPLVVTDESMVEVDGTMRRRLELLGGPGGEYWIEGVGSSLGFLGVGSETQTGSWNYLLCYHEDDHLVWSNDEYSSCMMTDEGWSMPFATPGAEWYFQEEYSSVPITQPAFGYRRYAVTGTTEIQGHLCSVINDQDYVYENNKVVYWYNQVNDAFTVLYDFNAEVGDTWYCDVNDCSFLVTVQSVGSVSWEGHTYRTLYVTADNDNEYLEPAFDGRIIEGIGYEKGLFPDAELSCYGCIDCDEISYMRCYLVDGEMLYHEGDYDCDYIPGVTGNCWDGTVAEAYDGGDGTPENPYRIATAEQLALLVQQTNDGIGGDAYYELTKDINLQKCTGGTWPWVPIGTATNMFRGHFDGNGHRILNLNQYISDGAVQPVGGLFGYTDQAAISNVQLVEYTVFGNGYYVGGLVGCASMTDISDCSIMQSEIKTTIGVAGGLVGFVDVPLGTGAGVTDPEPCYITNCSVGDAVAIEGFESAGGIVGQVNRYEGQVPCVITNCTVGNEGYSGLFTIISQKDAGGIVGWFRNGTITGCQNHYDIQAGGEKGVGGIVGQADEITLNHCTNTGNVYGEYAAGGIVGLSQSEADDGLMVINCTNTGQVLVHNILLAGGFVGGIAGNCWNSAFIGCVNKGDVSASVEHRSSAGGIVGYSAGKLANCYNRGTVLAVLTVPATQIEELFVGGIVGRWGTQIVNVYNTGVIDIPELPEAIPHGYGNIIGEGNLDNDYHNAYWLDDDALSACGMDDDPAAHGSSAFVQGNTPTSWVLHEAQYGTNDLLEALNAGAEAIENDIPELGMMRRWQTDEALQNGGLPILAASQEPDVFTGTEWYYEILNEDGSITYQYLQHTNDTVINDKDDVHVLVRINTLYDKGEHVETSHEYVYERDQIVYWWNKTLGQFTVLYNFRAKEGDIWEIKVGTESLLMHVDAVEQYEYEGRAYKMMHVSDANNLFSGIIVCGIGHLTSFFPERLMHPNKDYRVEGIRCFWQDGELVFKYGDRDCDEVYEENHVGLEEPSAGDGYRVYPNPTDGVIIIATQPATTPWEPTEYRITNLLGQTLMTGFVEGENHQINLSKLPAGLYFITLNGATQKIILQHQNH